MLIIEEMSLFNVMEVSLSCFKLTRELPPFSEPLTEIDRRTDGQEVVGMLL